MKSLYKQYGQTALVTGASSGIGLEFAYQLAKEGFNLFLVARRGNILKKEALYIESEYSVKVTILELDLTQKDAMDILEQETQSHPISLVIPNAGVETNGDFLDHSVEEETRLITLNCTIPMKMTHLFGKRFKDLDASAFIFISSIFAYQAVPYFANYAASKVYILHFAEALAFELKKQNTSVTVLSPGLTNTQMPKRIEMDLSQLPMKAMEPNLVVEKALKALRCKKLSVIPGFQNNIMAFMSQRLMKRKNIGEIFGKLNKKAINGFHR